ncbi:MAG: NAD(+) synthase [Oscillospiraceae bacterium]|nr:NAD(+) synthase [Oscillospiraceae bacterium]
MFNAEKTKNDIVDWIARWFEENGANCAAVVGISGGKDSSVVAALCAEALGRGRVVGVMMPNGVQSDIGAAESLADFLQIRRYTVNIRAAYDGILAEMDRAGIAATDQTRFNLPARLRMSALYAVSQSVNGRVANTCNLSEDYVGYSTRYGDSVGDFSPLSMLTVTEVRQIGRALGLPSALVDKTPADGLTGKTDEENLGFTYQVLDEYIRTGLCPDAKIREKIDHLHRVNQFKLKLMPSFLHID